MNSPSKDLYDILDAGMASGTTMYHSFLPDTPNTCLVILDTGGFSPDPHDYNKPTVQLRSRGTTYSDAYDLLDSANTILHEYVGTINSTRYIAIWKTGDVLSLGVDKNGRFQASLNFRIHRAPSS